MKTEKLLFLSYSPCVGGIATHEAIHISALEGISEIILFGEKIENTKSRIDKKSVSTIEIIPAPIWSCPIESNVKAAIQILNKKPNQIIVNNPVLFVKIPVALIAARLTGVKIVTFLHSEVFKSKKRLYLVEILCSIAFSMASKIIFVSHFTKKLWITRYPWMWFYTSVVFHNLVFNATNHKQKFRQGEKLKIGFVGRLETEKDPAQFCKVAKMAMEDKLNLEFRVYGSGSQLEAILPYKNFVQIEGVKTEREIFNSIDILLLTSRTENCPYVILEAKIRGIPCVANNVGGVPEIVTDGVDGILVASPTPQNYLDALKLIVRDYDKYRNGCLQLAKNFLLEHRLTDLTALYDLRQL